MPADNESNVMRSGQCLISQMLWNWETVDTCLISRRWHITSTAQFAASCIGVIILAMSLQLLRRLTKEYDSRLLKNHQRRIDHVKSNGSETSDDIRRSGSSISVKMSLLMQHGSDPTRFRPNPVEQLARAMMHVGQFIVAYFVMLWVLRMYKMLSAIC